MSQNWTKLLSHSNGKRETTTREPLLGTCVLVDLARFKLGLSLALHRLAALLLVVLSLHLLKFSSETLNFVLILVNLSLVHVELGSHGLHLRGLLLEVLLVNRQLLGDFGARLSGKQVLQLNVELFFLLDGHVLLNDLLSFLDESLLEGLNLEEELEGIGVSALELSPSVVVKRVFKLFREGLHLKSFFLKGITEAEYFFLVLRDLRSLGFFNL